MKSKDFKILLFFILLPFLCYSQVIVFGKVYDKEFKKGLNQVEIYNEQGDLLAKTDSNGFYKFTSSKIKLNLIYFKYGFIPFKKNTLLNGLKSTDVALEESAEQLSEVQILASKQKLFSIKRLKDVEGTAIFAGKKTEVILVDNLTANLATNNTRQIYSQIAGLNIYQNDDAGLQLNIGGRGLDPNRTSNFNTRQNNYDISADVLGYPESYYSPPSESLSEIQVIRGAASLQYGTQFGGLVNFKTKSPNPIKPLEVVVRNTFGSNHLYTNFTSLSGTSNKLSYYAYVNYKKGNGFRPNSEFESKNIFSHFEYAFSQKSNLSIEFTYLNYLAQQAGGLNDRMFNSDPNQSVRSRNWFKVNWLLYNAKFTHNFSEQTKFSFNFFGLNASRDAIGFRTNRVDQIDSFEERDLIKGKFRNFGFESRILHEYKFLGKKSKILLGTKFYKANNSNIQGPGSIGSGPDFSFKTEQHPDYQAQSAYDYPNLNTALFGEQIFYLKENLSVTPGFRIEYIKTASDGYYKNINLDAAGNLLLNETINSNEIRKRSFILLGIGTSYKPSKYIEVYNNISQNYRSVTFADISIVNPAFVINPNITDEKGYNLDIGVRGVFKKIVSYDLSGFMLYYNDRIGFVQKVFEDGNIKSERGNVGNAVIYGLESLVDFNLIRLFDINLDYGASFFVNTSLIDSQYKKSSINGITGKKVEFVPKINLKSGIKFSYKDFTSSIQYTYMSEQFTDATNSVKSNLSGVIGIIPSYDILDVAFSYMYKNVKIESGINNLFDTSYFTRRATGYPGPGIIPSPLRNWYVTLEFKF
ncbi:TonB-dependent receptor plug domain-containing protein [uncultured Polaribacter sp.]|uniref:TonB-dependent receptor family protein n=1 Tax=uncultured Polaribacter sp. TaxID=174711 RepID=UPI00261C0B65|nr:TonB-dependent receptor plug domain-containing protein [uncultured Polaribacter sp.]